jgi:hypothetical protein
MSVIFIQNFSVVEYIPQVAGAKEATTEEKPECVEFRAVAHTVDAWLIFPIWPNFPEDATFQQISIFTLSLQLSTLHASIG